MSESSSGYPATASSAAAAVAAEGSGASASSAAQTAQAGRKVSFWFFNKDYSTTTRVANLARLALLAAGTSRRVVETTIVSARNRCVFWFQEIEVMPRNRLSFNYWVLSTRPVSCA